MEIVKRKKVYMYKFIFYGIYRTLNYTVFSKGKEKQEDRRISTVTLTSVVMFGHIFTLFGILSHRFGLKLAILNEPNDKLIVTLLFLFLYLYNYLFHEKKLRIISMKYKPLYDKYKGLDKLVGFGVPILTFLIFIIFGTP
jgi:hypothetical protein